MTNNKEKRKVVCYARYSSKKQQYQSIEGQLRVCKEFAEREGLEIVEVYKDEAVSGKSMTKREALLTMLEDIETGVYQDLFAVLIYKMDRLGRKQLDLLDMQERLKKQGVKILTAAEANLEGVESTLTRGISAVIAEYYSKELAQKTARGMKQSMISGTSTGSLPPFGYKWENKRLVFDEEKKEAAIKIFEMYAAGNSKKEISEYLNANGYTNRKNLPFQPSNFESMLSNRRYIGEIWYKNEELVNSNANEPLISRELYERVQEQLKKNKKFGSHKRKSAGYYPLTGKVYCGKCKERLVIKGGRGRNATYYYYSCRKCGRNIRQDLLEKVVFEETQRKFKLNTDGVKNIADIMYNTIVDRTLENEGKDYKSKELEKIDEQIDNLVMTLANTPSLVAIIEPKILDLGARKQKLEEAIEKERVDNAKNKVNYEECVAVAKKLVENKDTLMRILPEVIKAILVVEADCFIEYKASEKESDEVDVENLLLLYNEIKEKAPHQDGGYAFVPGSPGWT